ncbi:hypothetical protein [Streptomyces nondiastaticus]|uniref:Uncharacterized protein n=1 Tax=Streptomyces nondiastaticus TaxID=3154512 RepID=A0ABW6TU55_9ACTN
MNLRVSANKCKYAVVALLSASALAVGWPAQAATGTFTYTAIDGKTYQITNPVGGKCYALPSPTQGNENNQTDAPVYLFPDTACKFQQLGVVMPGQTGNIQRAQSTLFTG